MNLQRKFEGVWIPKEIWLNEHLTLQEKVFLVEINSLDNGERGCYATNEYFSKFFGISRVRVSEIISSLVKKEFVSISIHHEPGRGNIRTLRTLLNFSLIGYNGKVEEGHKGKLKRVIKESLTAVIGINSTLNNTGEEEETAAAEILNFPLNENHLPQTNGAAPPSTLIELHDPETPGATIYDAVPTVEPPPNRINLYDRPNAKTPAELQEALSKFYVEFENEWSAGVLENSKGRRYPKERRTEIVRAFCCHAIKSNRGGDTFQMLNADLQAWFLRQPEFERTQPATNNKNSAVYEPPRNAVY